MNDTYELITRPVGIRLIEAEKLNNDEMERGLFPIYYNEIEDYALRCIDVERIDPIVMFMKYLDMYCQKVP